MQYPKQKKKLICIGDSNTYGFDPRGYWGGVYEHPWPDLIAENTGWSVVKLGDNGRQIPSGTAIDILGGQLFALTLAIWNTYAARQEKGV